MRILVTGATGFLGQHLVRALVARGDEVTSLHSRRNDLRLPGSLDAWDNTPFDLIFHLAAWTQAGDFCLRHPGEQWIINQQINTKMLTWWQSHQPQAKLISIGTSCAYSPDLPLTEEHYLTGLPIDSLFTYAMTKRMLYTGQLALHRQYGMSYFCVVPSTLYGADYHMDGRQVHFIFDLIRKILRAKFYGEKVVLWGDGHQCREILRVDDFVRATLYLTDHRTNDLVNIGAGEEFSIRHFAHLICSLVGYDENAIVYDTSRYVGAKSKCLDITKLREAYPGFAPSPLAEGLRQTIDWYIAQKETMLPPPE